MSNDKIKELGQYLIFLKKELGEGSYGKVYQGLNRTNNQQVAIKIIDLKKIQEKYKDDNDIQKKIKKEIENMQLIKGKNIVEMLDKIKTKSNYYIILELCTGGNLQQLLNKNGGYISENQSIKIITQIIEGYKILISKNMVHRDIKPANILFNENTAKLADFGFSKIISKSDYNSELIHSLVGTPSYCCPQIISKQPYCPHKADIWSLGVLFYQMLYRKLPFTGENYYDLSKNILEKPLSIPEIPRTTPLVKKLIASMLEKDEYQRISWNQLILENIFQQQNNPEKLLESLNKFNSIEIQNIDQKFNVMKQYCLEYFNYNQQYCFFDK
ncbi:protein kinase domain protein [Ichthyophthirius multifiliis]|uniref:Protein kinase domain protein n=1 Tax=Ichthyophthirius multifiliis TaxID=5932 RepID=G0QYE4_ICHMU|nr:protein kinase domain protein [Ichthyophthirius multifiliis]EGR29753.1 protein kinase domain protein [Ichthyophthirius multifiliis]|eukprot:XP_004030989.1 protein kinase domain protein [Ichthyophthirius multifiliis]